jgi:hypothetical protein
MRYDVAAVLVVGCINGSAATGDTPEAIINSRFEPPSIPQASRIPLPYGRG